MNYTNFFFLDAWEQRKLGEIAEIITGNTPRTSNLNYYDGDFLFVSPADIQKNRYVTQTNTTLTKLGFEVGRFIRKDSTLFVSIGSTIGKVGQASVDLITNQQINSVVPNENCDKDFMYSSLVVKSSSIKQLAATQAVPIINKTEFSRTIIETPKLEEQIKIGTFFKQLDETIALHQRKLDNLKQMKKGFLQVMFPVNDEKVPQVRFANFDSEWEQRKFENIVNRINKTSNTNELPKIEFEDIVAGEGRLNKEIDNKFDNRKGILFQPENILYGKLRPYLKNWLFPDFEGVALGDFWVFEATSTIPCFVYSLIQSVTYQRVANDTSGTKMPRSDWKKVSATEFLIPTDSREQEKIGYMFHQFDKIIILQKNKLEKLNTLKKAYLQNMFI